MSARTTYAAEMIATFALIAMAYGTLMALSPLLQLRRIREVGSSRDVSLANIGIIGVGSVIWCAYGLVSANATIVVPNVFCLLTSWATFAVAWRYRQTPETEVTHSATVTVRMAVWPHSHGARRRHVATTTAGGRTHGLHTETVPEEQLRRGGVKV